MATLVKLPLPPLKDQALEDTVSPATQAGVTLTHIPPCRFCGCTVEGTHPCYLLLLITYFFLHSVVNKVQSNLLPKRSFLFLSQPRGNAGQCQHQWGRKKPVTVPLLCCTIMGCTALCARTPPLLLNMACLTSKTLGKKSPGDPSFPA